MLAAAATTVSKSGQRPIPSSSATGHSILTNGPAATLSPKVVKKILDLEFVEMAEISMDGDTPQAPGRPSRLPITDISQWVERYATMAAILCTRFPSKAPELWAYLATIVKAERNYEGQRWVTYDRQYQREALARKDLNWSVTDPPLYNESFTGRAKSIERCVFCLQDDHTGTNCPKNPNRPVFGWFPGLAPWPNPTPSSWPAQPQPASGTAPRTPSQEICRRFNEGRCRQPRCRYRHICSTCFGPHIALACPQRPAYAAGRSRSPQRAPPRAGQPALTGYHRRTCRVERYVHCTILPYTHHNHYAVAYRVSLCHSTVLLTLG